VEYERRSSDYLKDPYVVYLVESRASKPADDLLAECSLWRRYSEFELLHRYLVTTYPYLVMPALPEKRLNMSKLHIATDKFDPEFLERRRLGLECFVLRLASHPVVSQDAVFRAFLNEAEGWKDRVGGNQWKEKLETSFKSVAQNVSQTVAPGTPRDERFEKMYKYGEFLESSIGAALKVHDKMFVKTCSILKQHAGYANSFNVWASLETEAAETLQSVASGMDTLAGETMTQLKGEETHYLDQLKEYLFMSASLKAIAQKHQSLQHDLAKADEKLSAKTKQKEQLIKDIHSMEGIGVDEGPPPSPTTLHSLVSLVMGSGHESLEDKQVKLLTVDGHVTEAEQVVRETEEQVNQFVDKSLADFDRFNRQKERDVGEIMEHYVATQVKVSQLGLKQWQGVRDSLMKL